MSDFFAIFNSFAFMIECACAMRGDGTYYCKMQYCLSIAKCNIFKVFYRGAKMVEFGQKLREKRKALGFTVKEVASKFGVAQPTWSLWEIGSREPSLEMLVAICRELQLSLDEMLGLAPVVPPGINAVVSGNTGNVAIGNGATIVDKPKKRTTRGR